MSDRTGGHVVTEVLRVRLCEFLVNLEQVWVHPAPATQDFNIPSLSGL